MPLNLSIKNVPDDVAELLKTRATKNHRSLQGELLAIIEAAVKPDSLTVEELADHIRKLGLTTGNESGRMAREDRDGR